MSNNFIYFLYFLIYTLPPVNKCPELGGIQDCRFVPSKCGNIPFALRKQAWRQNGRTEADTFAERIVGRSANESPMGRDNSRSRFPGKLGRLLKFSGEGIVPKVAKLLGGTSPLFMWI
jgi:hypothetical protein